MKIRKTFIRTVGAETIYPPLIFPFPMSYTIHFFSSDGPDEKKILIGITGAENSHMIGYSKVFPENQKFSGGSVQYVWGKAQELGAQAMEEENIPCMINHPDEMLGRIDAFIIDPRHPKYHLKVARQFAEVVLMYD